MKRRAVDKPAERVIAWLRAHIADRGLRPGDPLPRELDLAEAVGVARSSVREALIAMRVLGLIDARKRVGMRLLREPVLLDLRDWFAPRYDGAWRIDEAQEFRAVIEQGLIELIFARITAAEVAQLRRILDGVTGRTSVPEIHATETRFHRALITASRSKLALLFSALLTPMFESFCSPYTAEQWRSDHAELVATLERRDRAGFSRAMRAHTTAYLRLEASARAATGQALRSRAESFREGT
jgi:DNA-binding FadR family transcriptional regulator